MAELPTSREALKLTKSLVTMVAPHGDMSLGRFSTVSDSTFRVHDKNSRPGYYVDVKVTATDVVQTTDEFRRMSVSKRKCLYPGEKELKWFPSYSESNCFLECAWGNAAEVCGCVPWHLKSRFKDMDMCERFGNKCFNQAIQNRYQVCTVHA